MTQFQFEEQLMRVAARIAKGDKDSMTQKLNEISAKGQVAAIVRLCVTYPELAKAYYESQPKAIME